MPGHRPMQPSRNALFVILCIFIGTYTSHYSIRPITYPHFVLASAETTTECSENDQTCSAEQSTKCQVKTRDNCSQKELEYIDKMTPKSSEERKSQIDRLKELLTRGEDKMNSALIPWIKDRLHILYSLEVMDPSSDVDGEITTDATSDTASDNATSQSESIRLITPEELAKHTTVENEIWLSILGKVYDVTTGEGFYGPSSGSYSFYAGRDASPCFSSGTNNPKGAAAALEDWEGKKLMSVLEWSQFYEKHETYKFLGILAGSKYYDEEGNEKDVRRLILKKAEEAKAIADKEKEEKKKARLEKKKKLAEEREKKKKQNQKSWGFSNCFGFC